MDPTGHYECEDADCSTVSFTPGGYVYHDPAYSPLFHLISLLERGNDNALKRTISVLADTSLLNFTGNPTIDGLLGFAIGANFRNLGSERGDKGFKAGLGDEHLYQEVWGTTTGGAESRQVGHFLSAVNMGLRGSPGGLIVGHEQADDNTGQADQIIRAFGAYPNGSRKAFHAAVGMIAQNDVAGADRVLEPLLGQAPYIPTANRVGNSLEDLRLSTYGYLLGQHIRTGALTTNRAVANWVALNISDGW